MMDFLITDTELNALCGLPHIQQLTYLRGIRPYMDRNTGLAGIQENISYQSIAKQLYIAPQKGINSQSYSRDQIQRAIAGLERAGILSVQSEACKLILKLNTAKTGQTTQNKGATEAATAKLEKKN